MAPSKRILLTGTLLIMTLGLCQGIFVITQELQDPCRDRGRSVRQVEDASDEDAPFDEDTDDSADSAQQRSYFCLPVCGGRTFWDSLCRACCDTIGNKFHKSSSTTTTTNAPSSTTTGRTTTMGRNADYDSDYDNTEVLQRSNQMIDAASRILSPIAVLPFEEIRNWLLHPDAHADGISLLANRLSSPSVRYNVDRKYWTHVLSNARKRPNVLLREALALRASLPEPTLVPGGWQVNYDNLNATDIQLLPTESRDAILATAAHIISNYTGNSIDDVRLWLLNPAMFGPEVTTLSNALSMTLGTRESWQSLLGSAQDRPFTLLRAALALRSKGQIGIRARRSANSFAVLANLPDRPIHME